MAAIAGRLAAGAVSQGIGSVANAIVSGINANKSAQVQEDTLRYYERANNATLASQERLSNNQLGERRFEFNGSIDLAKARDQSSAHLLEEASARLDRITNALLGTASTVTIDGVGTGSSYVASVQNNKYVDSEGDTQSTVLTRDQQMRGKNSIDSANRDYALSVANSAGRIGVQPVNTDTLNNVRRRVGLNTATNFGPPAEKPDIGPTNTGTTPGTVQPNINLESGDRFRVRGGARRAWVNQALRAPKFLGGAGLDRRRANAALLSNDTTISRAVFGGMRSTPQGME